MNEEIMRVLKMLEEGKIDSQKASELISLLNSKTEEKIELTNKDKMFKVLVKSSKGDNVNINIPVKFISTLGNAIKKLPKVEGVEGLEGKIVDVKSESGDIVEVIVE